MQAIGQSRPVIATDFFYYHNHTLFGTGVLTLATASGQLYESLRATRSSCEASVYTEGLPFALKIAAGSRFNTAIKPYMGGEGRGEEGSIFVGGDGRGKRWRRGEEDQEIEGKRWKGREEGLWREGEGGGGKRGGEGCKRGGGRRRSDMRSRMYNH